MVVLVLVLIGVALMILLRAGRMRRVLMLGASAVIVGHAPEL